MLCVKNKGDTNKNNGGKNAGAPCAPWLNSIASKNVSSNPPAPTKSIANRVTSIENPNSL